MSRTELIFTDEEIDKLAEKIASKINITNNECLYYGEIARFKSCSIHFDMDKQHKDMFLIKDNNGDIVGRFVEVTDGKYLTKEEYEDLLDYKYKYEDSLFVK